VRLTSRMWSPDRKAGFTLIEVMAVMLIIALVASLVVALAFTGEPASSEEPAKIVFVGAGGNAGWDAGVVIDLISKLTA
jgi:prepilin-type N-terminal cleavage/methylation domain-containing protein